MRFWRRAWLLGALAAVAGCVEPPPERPADGWFVLQPGEARSILIDDPSGRLDGVGLEIPAGAVSAETTIRLSLAAATEPVFARAGQQLRTPAVVVEPWNLAFAVAPTLILPWYPFGETVEAAEVYAYRAPSLAGVPEGLWRPVTPETALPNAVRLPLAGGGLHWAATIEVDPTRTPADILGEPCLDADSSLAACAADPECAPSGCLGEHCGAIGPIASDCRPAAFSSARFGCACRCAVSSCQWVR